MKNFIPFLLILHLHNAHTTTYNSATEDEILCHEVRKVLHCKETAVSLQKDRIGFQNSSVNEVPLSFSCGNSSNLNLSSLNPEVVEKCSEGKKLDYVLVYVTIVSSFLLSLTIITYICLPSLLNIHGKSILCHLMNQLMSSGFQIAAAIILPKVNPWGEYEEFVSCWVVGFCLYFFTVSSNAWLVVINFDLWNTFRNKYQRDFRSDKSRFLMYSVFGWGIPIIAAIVVGTLEATLPVGHDFKPSIATDRCFLSFENTHSIILYFYVLIGLMLTYNFVIFTWTNVILCSVQSKVARAKNDSNKQQVKTRFFLFFKLFCVMGTTWVVSFALWILGYDRIQLKDRSNIARFFQLFNVFHGFCYFIVFVCKPSIYRLIKKKIQRASKGDDSEPGTSSRRISSMRNASGGNNTNSLEHKAAV